MLLIIFCCILSLTLPCRKFIAAESYALFGVIFFLSNLVLVKNYILHVWGVDGGWLLVGGG